MRLRSAREEGLLAFLVSMVSISCVGGPPSSPEGPRAVDSSFEPEAICISGPGRVTIERGRVAGLEDGARVVLFGHDRNGEEVEAFIERAGEQYQWAVRHGATIDLGSLAGHEWIADVIELDDFWWLPSPEVLFRPERDEAIRAALRQSPMQVDVLGNHGRYLLFPMLLLPDLVAAAQRTDLSEEEELALVKLCLEDFVLPPSKQRDVLVAALVTRPNLSTGARQLLVQHLGEIGGVGPTALE